MRIEDLNRELNQLVAEAHAAADRVERIEADRDAILAYAALLYMEMVSKEDGSDYAPSEAIQVILKNSMVGVGEAFDAGWGAGDYVRLMNCRDAVKGLTR